MRSRLRPLAWGLALAPLILPSLQVASAAPCSGVWTDAVEAVVCVDAADDVLADGGGVGTGLRAGDSAFALELALPPGEPCFTTLEVGDAIADLPCPPL